MALDISEQIMNIFETIVKAPDASASGEANGGRE